MRSGPIPAALLLAAAFAAGAPGVARPQTRPACGDIFDLAHPAVRAFTDRDGLPQNTVHAIARDRRGYLWVGTQDGAARWNGRAFTIVDMPDPEVSNYVRAMLAASDGSLWFGREDGGVVRLREEAGSPAPALRVFGAAEGLPAPRVNALVETRSGEVWAATHGGGAARLEGERFVGVSEGLSDLRLWALAEAEGEDGRMQLLAGGEGGLFVLEGARWRPRPIGTTHAPSSVSSIVAARGADGVRSLWVGTYGQGILRERRGRLSRFGPAQGLASTLVTALATARGPGGEEQLYAATRDAGLFRLEGERFVPVALGGAATEVYALLDGGDGDPGALWVGTRTAGLLRLEAPAWVALDRASGLPADQALGLLETTDADGRPVYWVGTGNGLAVVRGARLTVEGQAQGLPGPQVLALAEWRERNGPPQVWATVVGLGLARRTGGRWQRVVAEGPFDPALGTWLLASSDPDGEGVLWVGTERAGLGRLSRGRWSVLTTAEGLPSNHVLSLLETGEGAAKRLWVGTRGGGAALIAHGRVSAVWDRSSGLPNDDVLSLAVVRRPDGRPEVWAGTRAGVARRPVDGSGAWERLGVPGPAIASGTVLSILQDRGGRVYLGTQRGVVRLAARPARAQGANELEAEVFGMADGLPSPTANWGRLLDSRGRVLLATTGGVALLDPAREAALAAPAFPLVIERAAATRSGRPISRDMELPASDRDVTFELALLTPRRGALVRYRTELVGYDASPSEWTDDPHATYTNLPGGRYVFRARARDSSGTESGPVELPFSVGTSPWRQPLFLVLTAFALGLAGAALLRERERRHRRRARDLEALVNERTRQLQEANARLAELSVTDPLTGLANRRALEAHAEAEWRRLARAGGGLAVVMVDVDHFKAYNDSVGHLAGDECLRLLAPALRRLAQRPGDLVARYGGEEFACLLVGIDREAARGHAERLRSAVEALDLPHPASPIGPVVTVSLGVAWAAPLPGEDWRGVLAAADAALYRAKQRGRNRVERAE